MTTSLTYQALKRERHRDKKRISDVEWYARNKERIRERKRESDQRWRDANKDKVKARNKRWQDANKGYAAPAARAWHMANPDANLRKRYGRSRLEWDALFASQGAACAACKSKDPGKQPWHTDHDHGTGLVRGILCFRCNITLGMLGDSLESVVCMTQNLISYLSPKNSG